MCEHTTCMKRDMSEPRDSRITAFETIPTGAGYFFLSPIESGHHGGNAITVPCSEQRMHFRDIHSFRY